METKPDINSEIEYRIQSDINAFKGSLPERYALAWHGYLTALSEWQVISFADYSRLVDLLPKIADPNPIITINLGRE